MTDMTEGTHPGRPWFSWVPAFSCSDPAAAAPPDPRRPAPPRPRSAPAPASTPSLRPAAWGGGRRGRGRGRLGERSSTGPIQPMSRTAPATPHAAVRRSGAPRGAGRAAPPMTHTAGDLDEAGAQDRAGLPCRSRAAKPRPARSMINTVPPKATNRWPAAQRSRPTAFARSGSARPEVSSPCRRSTAADDVQRGDQAEHADHRGEEGVGQTGLAAHALEDLAGALVVADEVGRALGQPAVDGPGEEETDAPAEHAAPLQPPGQRAGRAQSAGRRARAGSAGSSCRHRGARRVRTPPRPGSPSPPTNSSSTHHRSSANDRCVLQPAQRRHPCQAQTNRRSRKRRPPPAARTPRPAARAVSPRASRALSVSWATTAAIVANTIPTPADAQPEGQPLP